MPQKQLLLDFIACKTYHSADFVVCESNQKAYSAISSWPAWPTYGLVIYGESKVGKTHLSHIFMRHAKGMFIQDEHLNDLEHFSRRITKGKAFIVDDAERLVKEHQTELFHFCNIVKERGSYVLFASSKPTSAWDISLKDLSSRLSVFPQIKIESAEDDLLEAILVKKLSEMQIEIDPAVKRYILTHSERSPADLLSFIEHINRMAWHRQKKVTIPLVKDVLLMLER